MLYTDITVWESSKDGEGVEHSVMLNKPLTENDFIIKKWTL